MAQAFPERPRLPENTGAVSVLFPHKQGRHALPRGLHGALSLKSQAPLDLPEGEVGGARHPGARVSKRQGQGRGEWSNDKEK